MKKITYCLIASLLTIGLAQADVSLWERGFDRIIIENYTDHELGVITESRSPSYFSRAKGTVIEKIPAAGLSKSDEGEGQLLPGKADLKVDLPSSPEFLHTGQDNHWYLLTHKPYLMAFPGAHIEFNILGKKGGFGFTFPEDHDYEHDNLKTFYDQGIEVFWFLDKGEKDNIILKMEIHPLDGATDSARGKSAYEAAKDGDDDFWDSWEIDNQQQSKSDSQPNAAEDDDFWSNWDTEEYL